MEYLTAWEKLDDVLGQLHEAELDDVDRTRPAPHRTWCSAAWRSRWHCDTACARCSGPSARRPARQMHRRQTSRLKREGLDDASHGSFLWSGPDWPSWPVVHDNRHHLVNELPEWGGCMRQARRGGESHNGPDGISNGPYSARARRRARADGKWRALPVRRTSAPGGYADSLGFALIRSIPSSMTPRLHVGSRSDLLSHLDQHRGDRRPSRCTELGATCLDAARIWRVPAIRARGHSKPSPRRASRWSSSPTNGSDWI